MKKPPEVTANGHFKQRGRYIYWHCNYQVAGCISLPVADCPSTAEAKKLCREMNAHVQAKVPVEEVENA